MQITDRLINLVSGVGNPAYDKTAGAEFAFDQIDVAMAETYIAVAGWPEQSLMNQPMT